MELEFWATTDVGRVRDHNEDNFLVDKRMNLFVVCDGMGGHAAGEVASAMSVKVVREVLLNHRKVFERLENDPDDLANRKSVLTLVEHAIHEACARIYQAAQDDASQRGMGTTCSLLLLAEGRGFIGHVGDSRIYLFRQDQVHQITKDHSLINEMIRLGKIQKGEEHNLPHKNAVTRAVGVNEFVEVDTFELDVFGGDSFLLCSDGLSGYFTDDAQIAELLSQDDVRQITEESIEFANAGGGKDNITTIVVRVTDDGLNTRDIQRTMEVMRATPFFQYLGYKEMVQMVNLSRRREVAAGETLFAAGSDPAGLHLLLDGQVKLRRAGNEIGSLLPGEYFGEMSIVDDSPQPIAAVADRDSIVLIFDRERFLGLLRQEPGLAVKLLWNFLQTFTARMREIPYEQLLRSDSVAEEPTPPSGTLMFEERVKAAAGHQPSSVSGEFVAPSTLDARSSDAAVADSTPAAADEHTEREKTKTRPSAGRSKESLKEKLQAEPPPAAKPAPRETPRQEPRQKPKSRADLEAKTLPTRPAPVNPNAQAQSFSGSSSDDPDATVDIGDRDALFEGMEWEDIVPGDLLEDEDSLRETVQMDGEDQPSPDETLNMEALRETKPSASNGAISGESVVKSSTPRAQVLKRTKLIVGERDEFDEPERTREVDPITEKKSDSTLEIELDDDNVEEIT